MRNICFHFSHCSVMWVMISNIFFFLHCEKKKLVLSFVKCFKTLKRNICFSCRSLRWKILGCVQRKTAKKLISPSAFLHSSFTTTEDGERTVNLVFGDQSAWKLSAVTHSGTCLIRRCLEVAPACRLQAESLSDLHLFQPGPALHRIA